MSLRYRLFLWISGLFLLTAGVGSFVQSIVTKNALEKAKENLCQKILESKEQDRKNLQELVSYQIMENQAKIDVLLNTISFSTPQLIKFAPTVENEAQGTWMACADLLQSNRWMDFIQNTNEKTVTCAIVPEAPPFCHAYRIAIDPDLSWVFFPDTYIGVRLFAIKDEYPSAHLDGEEIEEYNPHIPETYLLFPVQLLKNAPSFSELQQQNFLLTPPWIQGHEISLNGFLRALERARLALKEGSLLPPVMDLKQIRSKLGEEGAWEETLINPFPNPNILNFMPKEKFLLEKMNDLSMRNGEVNILWLLLSLFEQIEIQPPAAVATFREKNDTGPAAFIENLFASSLLFDDARYFASNAPLSSQSNIATTLAIIHPDNLPHVYLGNTAQFIVKTADQKRLGYLTVACDADMIMQQLVLMLHQSVFLMTGGKIASAFSAEEEKIHVAADAPFFASLLDEKMGTTLYNGVEYFFMRITPFPQLDLHFFLFNPTDREFALLHSLEEGSQAVAQSILFNIQICGLAVLLLALVILNYFAKTVTAPIMQLAASAKNVKEGNLDQVQIPLPSDKRKDEIATLCRSFDEMVRGLKEKEKVQGILNKVVSQDIAKEILAGQVHLGGEEKRVTVLFADIRDFTRMTQSMPPKEVIDLLNTCMTKISACVDAQDGVIDKYVGDEAMALFGAPVFKADSALRAIKSALEMIDVLKRWNEERVQMALSPVEMGIGIHTGEMLVGNMGAENRLNYTVIGSNVNLAARICSSAKGMDILISKDTLEENGVKEAILFEEMEPISLKGFSSPVILYRVQGIK